MTNKGTYLVDGVEFKSSDVNLLPESAAKILEQHPASQLDIMYVRDRLHQLGDTVHQAMSIVNLEIEDIRQGLQQDVQDIKTTFEKCSLRSECNAKTIEAMIPDIADLTTHKIVNGKFDKIEKMFVEIFDWQKIESIKNNQNITQLTESMGKMEKNIDFILGKTLYGWISNGLRDNAFKMGMRITLAIVILTFVILAIFHVSIVDEIWNLIKEVTQIFK